MKNNGLKQHRLWQSLTKWTVVAIVCTAGSGCSPNYVEARVVGVSMEPALADGEMIRYSKCKQAQKEIIRGIVIVHKWGQRSVERNPAPEALMLRRVIGVPGDALEWNKGEWRVAGTPVGNGELDEFQYKFLSKLSKTGITVPEKCYFVMGDNRTASWDSRGFGWVAEAEIVGYQK